jgi:type II secretory pathway predicted ATPase ExeA
MQGVHLSERLDAIHAGHPNIHHKHIRRQTLRELKRRQTILSLADDLDIASLAEQCPDALSHKVMVVG